MKNYISTKIFLLLTLFLTSIPAGAESYEYFFGNNARFNSRIPSPEAFLGYETGTHHTRYDQLVSYFQELDRISENARLEVIGHTTGGRPLLVLVVSSAENLSNLEEIRLNHLRITNPNSTFDHNTLPTINMLGFGVHGNESSAPEAAMLTAWYLLASLDGQVESYLNNGVWFIEPSRNPDGHDRHAQWVNSQKSKNLVADPADLEHNEAYPGRSFIVPTAQAQNRMVELFFNPDITVPDSVFYDGSTWTVVMAFGLPYSTISDNRVIAGRKPYENQGNHFPAGDISSYAYLISWSDYNSPALLSGLFKNDIVPYVALKPFSSPLIRSTAHHGIQVPACSIIRSFSVSCSVADRYATGHMTMTNL